MRRHIPSMHDIIELPTDSYLVVRPKGAASDYSQLLYMKLPYLTELSRLPGSYLGVLIILANYGTYQHTSTCTISALKDILDATQVTVYKALQCLKQLGIVRKVGKDTYRINPHYIWKGSSKDRLEAIKEWDTPKDDQVPHQ